MVYIIFCKPFYILFIYLPFIRFILLHHILSFYHTNYDNGSLAAIPALRGYLLGVSLHFRITNKFL